MSAKEDSKSERSSQEINFTCKFCGEKKPLSELVVMRQYFPPISVCAVCSKGQKKSEQ